MRFGIRDVAAQFGVSEKMVLRWVDDEGLPVSKVDGQYRFSPAALFEWATSRGLRIPPALFHDPQHGDREVLPNLVDALRAGGVVDGVPGTDKRSVLAALLMHVKLPGGVERVRADRESLLQILMARELHGSTGIGEGIAIPHVRNPIVMRVPEPMVVLGLLEKPLEFGALDHRPVHSLFLIITSTTRSHLHILSRLGYIVKDSGIRDLLAARAPAERILAAMRELESKIPIAGPLAGPIAVPIAEPGSGKPA